MHDMAHIWSHRTSSVVTPHFPPCLKQWLCPLHMVGSLVNFRNSLVSTSCLDIEMLGMCYCVQLCVDSGDLNSDPNAYTASALSTEPSNSPAHAANSF